MPCAGECKMQVHRFDGGTTTVGKSNRGCPDLSDEEAASILKEKFGDDHPDTKLEGCDDPDCICVRREGDKEVWSKPVKHAIPIAFDHVKNIPGPPPRTCTYTLSGTYEVRSSIYDGNCMGEATAKGHASIVSEKPVVVVAQLIKPAGKAGKRGQKTKSSRRKATKKKSSKKKARA